MKLNVKKAGMMTTVQDLGRWGFQLSGVPVAGAMDTAALRLGNIIVGNAPGAAALEVTLLGPEIEIEGGGVAAFAGAELGFSVNGKAVENWKSVALRDGDVLSFTGPKSGFRGYLCFAGGVDVPLVMGSRSTYTRAKIGGHEGRALKSGDALATGKTDEAWAPAEGFSLPNELRPDYSTKGPLGLIVGLQSDAFTKAGLETLFGSEYTISNESDRMGFRFDGPEVEHGAAADIVSDAIPFGAVQIPGNGKPIVMLADRQTTGGYTKVGVLAQSAIRQLVQLTPGTKVRFAPMSAEDAVAEMRAAAEREKKAVELRQKWGGIRRNYLRVTVNGKVYEVICEEI